ncbi:MFS transporter [uncultured Alsobacter sp.]|uniref:MFS transporter n=1 Tax=uncultured Alsobacter sp. TaxID=1748258 RepID=UPI0025FF6EA0|nr:MFS transporter [uncultured Alsobacter sp.]
MNMVRPLADRRIASLWSAQLLAATGAEFYMVAVIWTASSLIGRDAGFVSAMQAGALLAGSIFGGIVTDRWPHRSTMIGVNIARALLLLVLSGADLVGPIGLPMLIVTAVLVALATAVYDPALQATLPVLVADGERRHGVNGLFDATRRIARILGPGLVALVGSFVPTGQFFTITAVAFLLSAWAVHRGLSRVAMPDTTSVRGLEAVRDAVVGGARAMRGHLVLYYGLAADIVGNVTWSAGLLLGMALHLQDTSPTPLTDYGLMMAAYGVGNLASNVYLSGRRPQRPMLWLIGAKLTFGLGVFLLPFAPDRAWLMASAALAAVNGPLENLALLHIIQHDFPPHRIAQVYRLQMCAVFGGHLIGYLAASSLFALLGLGATTAVLGALTFATGIVGLGLARRLAGRRVQGPPPGSSP